MPEPENTLYYGDNLTVLREHVADESVDLIYLDPPFKSNQDYNVLFAEQDGSRSEAQIRAFKDTWRWDEGAARSYQEIVSRGPEKVAQVMEAFRAFLGESDMMAYLAMMAPRLVELRRVLKPTGSIYLHCDPTASHYLKILMDATFGPKHFRNEVIWRYRRWPAKSRQFQKMHDTIFFYSKAHDGSHVFSTLYGYEKLAESTLKTFGTKKQLADFSSGHRKPSTVDEETVGPPLSDVWEVSVIAPIGKERLGYPTQKPEALLERIIKASSNEGDTVLDPFCGCGTSIAVAQRLGRRWIGIDITHLAVGLIKHRLRDTFGERAKYEVIGEPEDMEGAKLLARSDPWQFQWWALSLVGARPVEQKKGADKGIDGRLRFNDAEEKSTKMKQIILSVKAGRTGVSHLRDLRGVVDREKAAIGVLISMEDPTREMRKEAASAGFYDSRWTGKKHPRLQLLTIFELLSGKGIDSPPLGQVSTTFRRAPKAKGKKLESGELGLGN